MLRPPDEEILTRTLTREAAVAVPLSVVRQAEARSAAGPAVTGGLDLARPIGPRAE